MDVFSRLCTTRDVAAGTPSGRAGDGRERTGISEISWVGNPPFDFEVVSTPDGLLKNENVSPIGEAESGR